MVSIPLHVVSQKIESVQTHLRLWATLHCMNTTKKAKSGSPTHGPSFREGTPVCGVGRTDVKCHWPGRVLSLMSRVQGENVPYLRSEETAEQLLLQRSLILVHICESEAENRNTAFSPNLIRSPKMSIWCGSARTISFSSICLMSDFLHHLREMELKFECRQVPLGDALSWTKNSTAYSFICS